jgi:MarR family transcriptional regulator, organic hydroperoxide resistance regulator
MKVQSRVQTAVEPAQARNEPQRARAARRSRVREGGAVSDQGSAPRTAASIDQDRRVFDTGGRSIPWAIRDLNRLFAATLEPLVSRDGVTVCHWYYLRILSEFDGLNQRELSQKVGVHPNTAVPALDNMEMHGLVKRVRDANDRRRMCVHLTAKGRRLRDEMIPDVSAMVFRSIANVTSSELDTFFKVIKRIEDNLVAEGGDIERGIEW